MKKIIIFCKKSQKLPKNYNFLSKNAKTFAFLLNLNYPKTPESK